MVKKGILPLEAEQIHSLSMKIIILFSLVSQDLNLTIEKGSEKICVPSKRTDISYSFVERHETGHRTEGEGTRVMPSISDQKGRLSLEGKGTNRGKS